MNPLKHTLRKTGPWIFALLVLPLLPTLSGCDSDPLDDGETPLPGNGGKAVAASPYDTTTVNGQQVIVVSEQDEEGIGIAYDDGTTTAEVTWTDDYVYYLDGRVFVNDGQTLTIEPGTVIKGTELESGEQATDASVLIVARGGTIMAEGTAEEPILFTAEADDVTDPADLPPSTRGLWGGVILLGHAKLNTVPGVRYIEGIPNEPRAQYGCGEGAFACDPEDDSGVFAYVSIRYGGVSIGQNNEINGLTMGGVGRGTEVHHVEVFNNQDDGFEWFGGTVNTHHLVAAFAGDDAFDIDQGHRGTHQFWFTIQPGAEATSVEPGSTGEHDGGDNPVDGTPLATPHIYNATYIGSGPDGNGGLAVYMRENFAGSYFNSIFTSYPGKSLEIEDTADQTDDSRYQFEEDVLEIKGNLFYAFGGGDTFAELVQLTDPGTRTEFKQILADSLNTNNRIATAAPVQHVSRQADGGLNPLPTDVAMTPDVLVPYEEGDTGFLEVVDYAGAFGTENWAAGWTFLSQAGYFE